MITYANVICNEDPRCRYSLEIPGRKALFVIGVNPSTADGTKSDPTMDSVLRLVNACGMGFDALVMLNLSAQRSTDPRHMNRTQDEGAFARSLEVMRELSEKYPDAPVLLAYGNNIERRPYLRDNLRRIREVLDGHSVWLHIGGVKGLTGKEHPRHPLYARADSGFVPFPDIDAYLGSL